MYCTQFCGRHSTADIYYIATGHLRKPDHPSIHFYLAKQLLNSEHLTIPNDSSGPEQDLDNPVLSHAAVTVSFDEDMQPGLTIKTRSTQQWTLIAAQTRAKLRNS